MRIRIALMLLLAVQVRAQEFEAVPVDGAMRWQANAADPGVDASWMLETFNDSGWTAGTYGCGYETGATTGARNLIATTAPNGSVSIYTRAHFTLPPQPVTSVHLGLDWDDGTVAWLNGVEIYRSSQMPAGAPAWNTDATAHESSNGFNPVTWPYTDVTAVALPVLHAGDNVLAVGVWNSGGGSSTDLVVVPRLVLDKTVQLVRSPYLQSMAPTRVTVRWRTDLPDTSVVTWGDTPGTLSNTASSMTLSTDHSITLTGLVPGRRQYYAVGGARRLEGGDLSHWFQTPEPLGDRSPFRAWALGDAGTKDDNQAAVRDAYTAWSAPRLADLILMLGDNAYLDGRQIDYQAAVFDMYPGFLRTTPVWPTYGNHDAIAADSTTQSGAYYDIFTLPAGAECGGLASGTEAYYSFDWKNVHFVCLDSMESGRLPLDAMATWLAQDLAQTSQEWLVAFWHHPPYSKGSHDSDTSAEQIDMRENLVPLLEDAGVDLVLSGHSHAYERSFLIDGHYGRSTSFAPRNLLDGGDGKPSGDGPYMKPTDGIAPHDGAVYVVAGCSGQTDTGPFDHQAMYLEIEQLGSVVLDFDANRLDVSFLTDAGLVRDNFTLIKGGVVPPVENCGNGIDDDGDTNADCADTDCASIDADGDAHLDCSDDCAPADPLTWGVPAEIGLLSVARNGATDADIAWPLAMDAGLAATYDVITGSLSELRADRGFTRAGCLVRDTARPPQRDGRVPGADHEGWWYLVRARTSCGFGPAGASLPATPCD